MDWYIPITILPAICLLILSTTTQLLGISTEIGSILSGGCNTFEHKISGLKIKQLTRLTQATTLLYVSAACFVLSGILGALFPEGGTMIKAMPDYVLLFGVIMTLLALGLLVIYGFKTISIRKLQHASNPTHTVDGE
ncbi:MAG: hypothetical protein ACJAZ9_000090 [Neolewinella sp.]|jgi:hypothetical protein